MKDGTVSAGEIRKGKQLIVLFLKQVKFLLLFRTK